MGSVSPSFEYSAFQSHLFASYTDRLVGVAPEEISSILKHPSTFLFRAKSAIWTKGRHPSTKELTVQQKQSECHSAPNAFNTVSVTGFRHFLHFVEKRLV